MEFGFYFFFETNGRGKKGGGLVDTREMFVDSRYSLGRTIDLPGDPTGHKPNKHVVPYLFRKHLAYILQRFPY